jgi:O-methyltransferase
MSDLTLPATPATPEELYLDLLKRVLTRALFAEQFAGVEYAGGDVRRALFAPLKALLDSRRLTLVKREATDRAKRELGRDWPADAESMIGLKRMDNVQACVTDVLRRGVPGDLVETGVWRGGTVIFMRAILRAYGDASRLVWAADSFAGLPPPDAKYAADAGDRHHKFETLAVSLEQVQENFRRYGLLDERVRFLKGWFKDTLPGAPIEKLSVVRLDGDMYESTMDALVALYPKLSNGGYLIVDDYGIVPGCRKAIEDYRREHGITEPIVDIDGWGAYWRREK